MTQERDGFLSRWSRLKREGPAPEPARPPLSPAPIETGPALPEGKSLEELIAELPRIEDLVPGQSLGAFMHHWVPATLRNAALRRMWLLDPAISGYVDPALDYAYDYNTPGAVVGFGPMQASSDQIREVGEMFDRALGVDTNRPGDTASRDDDTVTHPGRSNPPPSDPAAAQHDAAAAAPLDSFVPAGKPATSAQIGTAHPAGDGAARNEIMPNRLDRPLAKRHGRALPT